MHEFNRVQINWETESGDLDLFADVGGFTGGAVRAQETLAKDRTDAGGDKEGQSLRFVRYL